VVQEVHSLTNQESLEEVQGLLLQEALENLLITLHLLQELDQVENLLTRVLRQENLVQDLAVDLESQEALAISHQAVDLEDQVLVHLEVDLQEVVHQEVALQEEEDRMIS